MTRSIAGVYSLREIPSWPWSHPRAVLDLLAQWVGNCRPMRPVAADPAVRRAVEELDRDGVSVMRNVADPGLVEDARRDLDGFVRGIGDLQGTMRTKPASTGGTREYQVHEYQLALRVYRSHDPLVFAPTYAKFLLLPALTEVARCYLGQRWRYQAMIATRTEPVEPTRAGFAEWHHDARGRKLNAILLLTDVPEDGQATVVLAGSHTLLYSRARRERNFFEEEDVDALQHRHGWKQIVCHAPAGSLVLFDSNALHRGRRARLLRDAFQVNCMTQRRHLWPQEIPRDTLASLAPGDRRTLLRRANLRVI